ncbi:MAG: hypothetical protein KIS87_04370 [Phycisphaeraceae bacterium]|nr:hypothetical protein [Phycisphaeraceae bacterium]
MNGPRTVLRAGVAVILPVIVGLWAFAPLPFPALPEPLPTPAADERGDPRPALDLAAFHAPLWVTPPPPPPPEPTPAPPTPLRFQLLAVLQERGGLAAVLYDPDADRLLVVAEGQELAQGRTVERVTTSDVRIRDAAGARTLALEQSGAPGAPGGRR